MGVGYLVGLVEKGGVEKIEELVWKLLDGDGSESANSSGVSILGLLSCEMEYKTEILELVSEFMPDVILLVGKSGGGKAKSGIIVIGVLRLVGWEFERCRDPSCRLIVG